MRDRVILDCSTLLPGPFAGKLLAEKGARVFKVESPDRPDPGREISGGTYYTDLNEKKTLIWLDLLKPADRTQFAEHVRRADGLIEGFRPQAKAKLGLDQETLLAINPKLAIVSLCGFREDGPRRDHAAHDINFQAVTGSLSLIQEMPGMPMADILSGYEAALAMSTLLDEINRGAPGRRIAVSMSQTIYDVQSKYRAEFGMTRQHPHYGDTLMTGKYPCYGIHVAKDGRRIAVGSIEVKFWNTLCTILGIPEILPDRVATGDRGTLAKQKIAAAFAAHPWSYWEPKFKNADCCVDPILNYNEVDPHGL